MISKIIDKYRQEAYRDYYGCYNQLYTWRQAILESIFRPEIEVKGKGPMTHLHPNIKKLHLPHDVHIADWRKYKVEDHPILVNFQKRCHASGLHDPWLRNHAFKFYPNTMGDRSRLRVVTTGWLFGLIAGSTLYILERIYDKYYPTEYWTAHPEDK